MDAVLRNSGKTLSGQNYIMCRSNSAAASLPRSEYAARCLVSLAGGSMW